MLTCPLLSAGCDREEDEATGGGEVGVREGSGEVGSSAAVRWQGEVSLACVTYHVSVHHGSV